MKHYESDQSARSRNNAFAAPATASVPSEAAYAGHTPLEQMHLGARIRTKSGLPLDTNVPPLAALHSASVDTPSAAEQAPASAAPPFAFSQAASHGVDEWQSKREPYMSTEGMPGKPHDAPLPREPESSSLHTMLIGSLITASVAIGLGASLWINSIDPPREQALASPWEEPLSAAASDSHSKKENKRGFGDRILSALGFAQEEKPITGTDAGKPKAGGDAVIGNVIANNRPLISELDKEAVPSHLPDSLTETESPPVQPSQPPLVAPAPPSSSLQEEKASYQEHADREKAAAPAQSKTVSSSAKPAATPQNSPQAPEVAPSPHKKKSKSSARSKLAAKSRSASTAMAKGERGNEIGRLKSQAFSETASDRIQGKKAKQKPPLSNYIFLPQSTSGRGAPPPGRAAGAAGAGAAGTQCQRQSNFFRREYCKWQVCEVRWGKHCCPSFETKSASY